MAVEHDETGVRLPCGRDALEVWDRAARGDLDEHGATCPYCQQVVAEHSSLAGSTRDLAEETVEPPEQLVARVMGSVRLGLRRRAPLPLSSPLGPVTIDAATAALVLRHAALDLSDVRIRDLDLRPAEADAAPAPPAGPGDGAADGPAEIVVTVAVEVRAGVPVLPVVGELRAVVADAAAIHLGTPVGRVDIDVTDLFGLAP